MILAERTKKSPVLLPLTFGASEKGWHAIEAHAARCPKEYQFSKVRLVKPMSLTISEALSVGLLLHTARAQWFYDGRQGNLWREAMDIYAKTFPEREGSKLDVKAMDIAVSTFKEYVAYWSVRPKTKVLAVEHEVKPRPLVKDAPPWAWRGARLDSIEKHQGKVWIGEMKSTSASGNRVADTYLLHGQTLLQACLWGEEENDLFGPLAGILLDVVVKPSGNKKAKPLPRVSMPIERMRHAMDWFARDFTNWVMQTHLITWDATVERRMACMRPYGPCDYRSLCLKGRAGTNLFVFGKDKRPLLKWTPSPGQRTPPWE